MGFSPPCPASGGLKPTLHIIHHCISRRQAIAQALDDEVFGDVEQALRFGTFGGGEMLAGFVTVQERSQPGLHRGRKG